MLVKKNTPSDLIEFFACCLDMSEYEQVAQHEQPHTDTYINSES